MKKRFLSGLVVLNLIVILGICVSAGLARLSSNVFDQIDLLVDVRHEIVRNYVEEPDQQHLIESAVRAMVDALNDRYTIFLTPDELEPFDKQIRGSFSGIGAEIDLYENRLRIVSPLEESPAWHAGVMAGDVVLEIDGQSTEGIKITDAVKRLTGPEGTQVVIKVLHESGEEATIAIKRARINVRTVKGLRRDTDGHWDYMLDPNNHIGYIRITQFTSTTADDLRQALHQLENKHVRGLILDLRFNPGGLLESAVEVSDLFLDQGKRIVSVKGRTVSERVETSTHEGTVKPIPLVVLANEASASAAEIVTGALSDNGRAKFIGTRTFGKGSVQQVKMLENGEGALKITNAYYYLPNGRNIHRKPDSDVWGVDPEDGFYVPMTPDQVRQMIEVRREGDILRLNNHKTDSPVVVTPEWAETKLADLQLAAALKALLGKLNDDDWPIVGKSGAVELARQGKRDALIRQRDLINDRLAEINQELAKLEQAEESQATPATQPSDSSAEKPTAGPQSPAAERVSEKTPPPLSPSTQPAQPATQP